MLQGNQALQPPLLRLCSKACKLPLVKPGACAPQQEKPLQGDANALQLESSPCSLTPEKGRVRPSTDENKLI